MDYDSVPLRDFKELNDWETVIFVYQSALKQVETKIDILNGEFQHRHKYNPIEHVKSRIKTPESIVKKLKRHGYESSIENMVRYVNDIAGIRISCSFTSDIYLIADMISKQNDLTILARRDYMKNPKKNLTVPAHARVRRVEIDDRMSKLLEYSNNTHLNNSLF